MKTVLTLLSILFVVHHAAAQCSMLKQYNTTLQPACDPNDMYIKWPNYQNQATYYRCTSLGSAVITSCPEGQYFCYVMQQCTSCANYIPPVRCSQLKTQNPAVCVPNDGSGTTDPGSLTESTYPTPIYPSSGTSKPTTRTTMTTTTPKGTTESTAPTGTKRPPFTIPTPPTEAPTTATDIPEPPSPSTNDPNVPMPPTPAPTPPSVNVEPPYLPSP